MVSACEVVSAVEGFDVAGASDEFADKACWVVLSELLVSSFMYVELGATIEVGLASVAGSLAVLSA